MARDRSNAPTKNDAKDRFVLRFHDEGQRVTFKDRAARNKRTMNAEILFLLEAGVAAVDGKK
jgi:hypothetical protein